MFALVNFLFLDFFHPFCITGVILIDSQVSVKSATLMLSIKNCLVSFFYFSIFLMSKIVLSLDFTKYGFFCCIFFHYNFHCCSISAKEQT